MTRHPWKAAIGIGTLAGLFAAGVFMYIAWSHNPQGEIHTELGVNWGYWMLLGLGWFVPVFVATSLVLVVILWLYARSRARGAV